MAKQKLSPKAAAAKKRRDIAMAKTPVRKAKKAQNQRIGQRSDSDIHHKNDGSVIRTSIKKNRGNFGRGTKNENNMKKKSAPTKFGPKRKTTKKKLPVDPLDIKGKITKVADAADKEMKNLISNVKTIAKTDVPKAIAGDAKKALNKVGDFIKTSKSTRVKGTGFFKMKRRSDGSMAKLKDQSFMKRMKMMNEASSPMNKEMEKIPKLTAKDMIVPGSRDFFNKKGDTYQESVDKAKEAAHGRHLINMEKQKRERMTKLAKENPDLFFKTFGQSPSTYLSSLPYG